jgi:glutathione synthase/RimK-type ligase-like ATP-grasp enzyme
MVHTWPPWQHVDRMGSKIPLMQNLDFIASTVTKSKRPITEILDVTTSIPDSIVLKRTHSDCGNHVLFPGDPLINPTYLLSQLDIPGSRWLGQNFVPTLRKLGEWRVFIIGGQIVDVVHTRINHETGCWKWERTTRFWSLGELRQVY